jgi:hypothetical protein
MFETQKLLLEVLVVQVQEVIIYHPKKIIIINKMMI